MTDRRSLPDNQVRNAILGRVRAALTKTADLREAPESGVASPGGPATPKTEQFGLGVEDIDLFEETVSDYKATVKREPASSMPQAIAELVETWGIKTLVIPSGLDRGLLGSLEGDVRVTIDDGSMSLAEISEIEGVITGCTCAIAETGTIVLSGQPDEGRRAITLLPDYHIAIVGSSRVIREVAGLFEHVGVTNPVTLISGPSATSDIELRRVEGVHGPRNLAVLIVTE